MSLKDFVVATSLLIASFSPSSGIEPGPFYWEYAPLPTQLQVPGHSHSARLIHVSNLPHDLDNLNRDKLQKTK